jgi:hypothetical protein
MFTVQIFNHAQQGKLIYSNPWYDIDELANYLYRKCYELDLDAAISIKPLLKKMRTQAKKRSRIISFVFDTAHDATRSEKSIKVTFNPKYKFSIND